MVYNVYKKSKNATMETNFVYHGSYGNIVEAKTIQAELKKQGFRTRRDITAYTYRVIKIAQR